jgi:hypothetical protein
MKTQYDIKFAARKYTTQDGQEKTYWSQHGTLWVEGDKITIKIDSIPQSASWDGYFKAFLHQPKQEYTPRQAPKRVEMPFDDEDSIPF